MVFTQILMDSVSRCFGVPDEASPTTTTTKKYADQPLGASTDAKQHPNNNGDVHDLDARGFCQNDHPCHLHQAQLNTDDRPVCDRPVCGIDNFIPEFSSISQNQQHPRSTQDQYSKDKSIQLDTRLLTPINPHPSHIHNDSDSTDLAQARRQAFLHPPSKRHSTTSITTPNSKLSLTHEASIEKARSKCNKRKLDIFRTPNSSQNKSSSSPSPSFGSRLFGDASFPSSAMLCFANPILDDEEEMKLQRVDEMMPEDEETVASTLYWDAKYAHVVEKRPPMGLYPSFRVGEDGNLLDIFQSGSHKSITSIYCTTLGGSNPPPPPNMKESRMESMVDESDDEDENEDESEVGGEGRTSSESSKVSRGRRHHSAPSLYPLQDDLDVISMAGNSKDRQDMDMRNLKLMSNNSSHSTAALTPVCSSRSHASMSPVPEGRHRVATSMDVNEIHETPIH